MKLFNIYVLLFFVFPAFGQKNAENQINIADSLYRGGQYTQALDIYDSIINVDKKIKLSSLLKIAKIHEGLGNYSKTIGYLILYRKLSGSKEVDSKINQLADKYDLKGFEFSDMSLVRYNVQKYRIYILSGFLFLSLVLVFIQVFKKSKPGWATPVSVLLILIFCISFYVLTKPEHKAIVVHDNSIMHDAPSAGGNKVELLRSGHQVKIIGEKDIWFHVELEDKTGWIRKNNLWEISIP